MYTWSIVNYITATKYSDMPFGLCGLTSVLCGLTSVLCRSIQPTVKATAHEHVACLVKNLADFVLSLSFVGCFPEWEYFAVDCP